MSSSSGTARQREALRQQMLLRAILARGEGLTMQGWVREAAPRAQRGLQAYRANLGAAAERALASAFPTVQQLMGDGSFAAMARVFVRTHPPARGDLAWLGEPLPGFIAASESLSDEPYLADVARLDWAVQRAESAADYDDASPDGLERLADIDPAQLAMQLRPGLAVVESVHPIVSIWLAHHGHDGRDADRFAPVRGAFAAGRGECAVVWRDGWRARVAALAGADARFTRAVLAADNLAAALDAAGPDFAFEPWLVRALRDRWLAGIHLSET